MWRFEDSYDLLPNIRIKSAYKDDILFYHQIYPIDGYVLRIPTVDTYQMDEDGDFLLDENGNKIIESEYRTTGGAMVVKDYNWEENPNQYTAEKYNENMELF